LKTTTSPLPSAFLSFGDEEANDEWNGSWTNINTTFDTFVTDLAVDSWQTFDLKLLMATTSSTVDPMSLTVTFKSVAS